MERRRNEIYADRRGINEKRGHPFASFPESNHSIYSSIAGFRHRTSSHIYSSRDRSRVHYSFIGKHSGRVGNRMKRSTFEAEIAAYSPYRYFYRLSEVVSEYMSREA